MPRGYRQRGGLGQAPGRPGGRDKDIGSDNDASNGSDRGQRDQESSLPGSRAAVCMPTPPNPFRAW